MHLLAAALLSAWIAPVPGHVTRPFDLGADPFEAGRHRGADLAARPGTPVRAACGGRVAVARRVGTSGRVVTIRCGPWRVTALPLATLAVHPGERVRAGTRIGTAARSPGHAGLHLGVRRATDRFGYVDPLRLLAAPRTPAPPAGPAPRRAPPPTGTGPLTQPREPAAWPAPRPAARPAIGPAPRPAARPASGPAPRPAARPAIGPAPRPAARPAPRPAGSNPVAPWPVWAGLGLALAGALGAVAVNGPRIRRAPLPRASPERVR